MSYDPDLLRDFARHNHAHYMRTAPEAPGADCDGRVRATLGRVDPPGTNGGGCSVYACLKCGRLFALGLLKGEHGESQVVAVWEPSWTPSSQSKGT